MRWTWNQTNVKQVCLTLLDGCFALSFTNRIKHFLFFYLCCCGRYSSRNTRQFPQTVPSLSLHTLSLFIFRFLSTSNNIPSASKGISFFLCDLSFAFFLHSHPITFSFLIHLSKMCHFGYQICYPGSDKFLTDIFCVPMYDIYYQNEKSVCIVCVAIN